MNPYESFFKGKRVTVMGLGLLGRGVGDAEFLAQCGANVLVTDLKTEQELAESVARLKRYKNITFHLGGHNEKDFTDCDMVIKAAGVPLDSPYTDAARKSGVPVYMSTALFAKFAASVGATIVGVTGTRGKSTVAHMIFHVLHTSGRRAHLGGNIRGFSTLAMIPKVEKGDTCILELDSWQLQGFGDLEMSPHIAVFTNFMADHLNYYKGDMEAYFADKAHIFEHQTSLDTLIAGASVAERIRAANPPLDPIVPENIPRTWKLQIPGEHNRENASLAKAALEALGLSEEEIQEGLISFTGVEGRLQFMREINGVKIYNDNNATTPAATIAALHSLGPHVVLISGGADKHLDLRDFISAMQKYTKAVVFLAGTGTDRLRKELLDAEVYDSIYDALRAALSKTREGDTILFSPAFASFGLFKNEYDRNDQFVAAVRSL